MSLYQALELKSAYRIFGRLARPSTNDQLLVLCEYARYKSTPCKGQKYEIHVLRELWIRPCQSGGEASRSVQNLSSTPLCTCYSSIS